MCGFIGWISKETIGDNLLERARTFIVRRGPDAQGLWRSRDKHVGILHRRLAIVDKDPRANQPFCDPQSGLTVAFAGEIYNFRELKKQSSSFRFRTESDTEVIIAVFKQYGIEGLSLLKGMFSLAIIDEKNNKIILSRGPIGKVPLYLARWQDNVFFGVSALALTALNNKPVGINDEMVPYYWENAYIHPAASVLSGVRPVLPGWVLELDWQGNVIKELWLQPKKERIYYGESPERVNLEVGELLKQAVRLRLEDNPKPTVLLSGGIDSTLICKIASDICKENSRVLEVITLRSLVPLTQDEAYARFAARRMNLALRLLRLDLKNMPASVVRAIDLQDEPLGMPSFFLLERLIHAVSARSRIVLSGDGGDELFLGYGRPADWQAKEINESTGTAQTNYGLEVSPWMSDWAKKAITEDLVGHMLAKADRASAEQGVEMRCPFLDADLINYARSLPFEVLVAGGQTKALLKEQLNDWPQWFLGRPKLGFAYNLRWHWALSNYSGLRESIDKTAIETFSPYLPLPLRLPAYKWRLTDIFANFEAAWRLLAWSRFLERLKRAGS